MVGKSASNTSCSAQYNGPHPPDGIDVVLRDLQQVAICCSWPPVAVEPSRINAAEIELTRVCWETPCDWASELRLEPDWSCRSCRGAQAERAGGGVKDVSARCSGRRRTALRARCWRYRWNPAIRGRRDRAEPPEVAHELLAGLPESERAFWAVALFCGLQRRELRGLSGRTSTSV